MFFMLTSLQQVAMPPPFKWYLCVKIFEENRLDFDLCQDVSSSLEPGPACPSCVIRAATKSWRTHTRRCFLDVCFPPRRNSSDLASPPHVCTMEDSHEKSCNFRDMSLAGWAPPWFYLPKKAPCAIPDNTLTTLTLSSEFVHPCLTQTVKTVK